MARYEQLQIFSHDEEVVYLTELTHGPLKLGHTTNLANRRKSQFYGPILMTLPGTMATEREMQAAIRPWRIPGTREEYRNCADFWNYAFPVLLTFGEWAPYAPFIWALKRGTPLSPQRPEPPAQAMRAA